MKGLLIGVVMIGAMVDQVAAQGVVTMETDGGAHLLAYSPGRVVVPPVGDASLAISNPLRWGQPFRPSAGRHGDSGFNDSGYASDPAFYPDRYGDASKQIIPGHDRYSDPAFYPDNDGDAYPVVPSAIVVTPLMQQTDAAPAPSPGPARSEMSEYHWPSSGSASSATTYSIVSKDGWVQSAIAVWVQNNALCYYTPDHSTGRMPIDSIDRQATRDRNAEKQLSLWLPPEGHPDLAGSPAWIRIAVRGE